MNAKKERRKGTKQSIHGFFMASWLNGVDGMEHCKGNYTEKALKVHEEGETRYINLH